jgi:undecaprenyl-diphosphatase
VLGAAQGIAEVIPVSSSAHLALLPWLLDWDEPSDRTTLAAGLHAGSCVGIAWALRDALRELSAPEIGVLAAASVPAAVAGLLAGEVVEARLGTRPQLALLLATAGVVLWLADRSPQEHGVRGRDAAAAAVAQVAALAPGVSRSGATLSALRLLRVERASAERFTLLMSLPITAGAAALSLLRAERADLRALARPLAAGIPAAAASAAMSTRGQARRAAVPVTAAALYRLGLAAVVAARHLKEKL